jgi:hypothetical protein
MFSCPRILFTHMECTFAESWIRVKPLTNTTNTTNLKQKGKGFRRTEILRSMGTRWKRLIAGRENVLGIVPSPSPSPTTNRMQTVEEGRCQC